MQLFVLLLLAVLPTALPMFSCRYCSVIAAIVVVVVAPIVAAVAVAAV